MTEIQLNSIINNFISFHKQYPHLVKNYPVKLVNLQALKPINNYINWRDVEKVLDKEDFITILNALNKQQGYSSIKFENGQWLWNGLNTAVKNPNLIGSFDLNKGHPVTCIGIDQKTEEILVTTVTKNPNDELQAFCKGTYINEPLEFKRIKLLNSDPKVQLKWIKYWNKSGGLRPENTAYLGENGDKLPIYIASNYDINTKLFTPQYISQVLLSQYFKNFSVNPFFYEINQEKPDDLIKLAILVKVWTKSANFTIYNSISKNFRNFDDTNFIPSLPYQQPNILSILLGAPPSYHTIKQDLNSYKPIDSQKISDFNLLNYYFKNGPL